MSAELLEEIRAEQVVQGKTLAAIDERTLQHEGRMDRADRRAAKISGITGFISAIAALFVKSLFPGAPE